MKTVMAAVIGSIFTLVFLTKCGVPNAQAGEAMVIRSTCTEYPGPNGTTQRWASVAVPGMKLADAPMITVSVCGGAAATDHCATLGSGGCPTGLLIAGSECRIISLIDQPLGISIWDGNVAINCDTNSAMTVSIRAVF